MVLRPRKAGSSSRLRKLSALEHLAQAVARAADVDDDAVGIELGAAKLDVDDVGRAVQLLRRAEDFAVETVRDHEVIADGDAEHACASAQ